VPISQQHSLKPVQQVHYYRPQKEVSTAVLLEVIPGLFGIFGIGHIYTGRVGLGLAFLFGFWAITFINSLLIIVFIGIITTPLCWIATLIVSPIMASNYCKTLANASPPVALLEPQFNQGTGNG